MAQSTPLILKLVSFSVSVANFAGKIIRDVMKKGELNIVDKGVQDYQTEADRLAQEFIVKSLSHRFHNVHIIGEEDSHYRCNATSVPATFCEYDESVLKNNCPEELNFVTEDQVTIWVDPLDGTSEYTQGSLEHVTVLIGIAVDGKAVAGVIHQPYYNYKEKEECGRTIWGIQGLGVFGYQKCKPPENCRILTTTRSHSNTLVEEALEGIKADEIIRVGGAGHKVLLLLEGKAHAYIFASQGCKRWDTCAPEAVLHAAGGLLTDINGYSYSYNKETNVQNTGGVLATALKDEHSLYVNLLPNHVKEHFKN